jgi:ABC-2 type transport system permease protein
LSAVRLSVAAALAGGASGATTDDLVQRALAAVPPEVVDQQEPAGKPIEGLAYYGPAMAMFFVLFSIGFTARGFFVERKEGTLDRIAAAPVPSSVVLIGKALSVFVYALASLATMAIAAALIFGTSWGSPWAVAVLCVAIAASVVALAAFVMSVARTERSAETLASALTFSLALFGGNFAFLGSAPVIMRRIAAFTPNGLALRGFTDLATGATPRQALVQPVIGIAVFTVAVASIAALFSRRAVLR